MKNLFNYIVEARETTETIQIKEGKNFINSDAKQLVFTGNVDYAEIWVTNNSKVESIDFSEVHATDLYVGITQCNKLKSITGGTGDRINVRILKNVKLEHLDLSGYKAFGNNHFKGQVTYIENNKRCDLIETDLPKLVDDQHGFTIDCGSVKLRRSNGMKGKNKIIENPW